MEYFIPTMFCESWNCHKTKIKEQWNLIFNENGNKIDNENKDRWKLVRKYCNLQISIYQIYGLSDLNIIINDALNATAPNWIKHIKLDFFLSINYPLEHLN